MNVNMRIPGGKSEERTYNNSSTLALQI